MNKKNYQILSSLCLVVAVIVWIPNVVFKIASTFWLATFVLGIIGTVFAALGRNYLLMIGNIIMFFSFFILMAIGYHMNS
ncbi:hypothetical protein [Planococcus alpniumensis]|uniref:hypothetical protein n=1 Tax=Planococcus alpniumensis TaxID=2708345 RepID=UPI001B8BB23D|nr:hypothetical protein [Planococcus sp. MSAK28401]